MKLIYFTLLSLSLICLSMQAISQEDRRNYRDKYIVCGSGSSQKVYKQPCYDVYKDNKFVVTMCEQWVNVCGNSNYSTNILPDQVNSDGTLKTARSAETPKPTPSGVPLSRYETPVITKQGYKLYPPRTDQIGLPKFYDISTVMGFGIMQGREDIGGYSYVEFAGERKPNLFKSLPEETCNGSVPIVYHGRSFQEKQFSFAVKDFFDRFGLTSIAYDKTSFSTQFRKDSGKITQMILSLVSTDQKIYEKFMGVFNLDAKKHPKYILFTQQNSPYYTGIADLGNDPSGTYRVLEIATGVISRRNLCPRSWTSQAEMVMLQ